MDDFLTVRHVNKRYGAGNGGRGFLALSDINIDIAKNEFVSIVGKSGCGKSTLLRMIAGLVSCEEGEIALEHTAVTGPSAERGLVFQEYVLFPWRSVAENIGFGLELKGVPARERADMVASFVSLVGLKGFETAFPSALSGGMRQRVAIAAVLANDPKVLLMDEPFGALDAQTRLTLQRELTRIWQSTKKCVVMVTHSVEEAIYLSQRVVVMKSGPGEIEEVIEVPLPYPRDVTSPEFNKLKGLLLDRLHDREAATGEQRIAYS